MENIGTFEDTFSGGLLNSHLMGPDESTGKITFWKEL